MFKKKKKKNNWGALWELKRPTSTSCEHFFFVMIALGNTDDDDEMIRINLSLLVSSS